jgi:hypothetical protein
MNNNSVYLSSDEMARKLGMDFIRFRQWVNLALDADTPEGKDFREFLIKHYGVEVMAGMELSEVHEEGDGPPDLLGWVEREASDTLSGDFGGFSRSASPVYGALSGPKIERYWAKQVRSSWTRRQKVHAVSKGSPWPEL